MPLALLCPSVSSAASAVPDSVVCGLPVLRVVDGDTLVVNFHNKAEKIRLLNVDTPESVHPDKRRNTAMGKAASDYTRSRLNGKTICLEFEGRKRGNYGRLLAYAIRDGQNFNLELVRQGWSPYYTKYGISPRYHEQFTAAQHDARSEGRHIWADSTATASLTLQDGQRPKDALASAAEHSGPGPFSGNTGSRIFHSPNCRWYHCKHCARIFATREEAVAKGFKPCSLCRP